MDTANSIDNTPVMDEKGTDITPGIPVRSCLTRWIFPTQTARYWIQVNFTIPEKKTTTCIVGPSGQVRQRCATLIALLGCERRKITIGSTDVRDFKLDSLMKKYLDGVPERVPLCRYD